MNPHNILTYNKDINTMKELFCNSITLSDTDFKLCWNFMFDELTNKRDLYNTEQSRYNQKLLVENTAKTLDISRDEISKVSNLFAGFYSKKQNRLKNYEYYRL